jgi:transposase
MTQRNRKRLDPAFKARVALAAMQERERLAQLGKKFGVHPVLVGQWKKQLLEKAASAFTRDSSQETERVQDELLKKIGELTVRCSPRELFLDGITDERPQPVVPLVAMVLALPHQAHRVARHWYRRR